MMGCGRGITEAREAFHSKFFPPLPRCRCCIHWEKPVELVICSVSLWRNREQKVTILYVIYRYAVKHSETVHQKNSCRSVTGEKNPALAITGKKSHKKSLPTPLSEKNPFSYINGFSLKNDYYLQHYQVICTYDVSKNWINSLASVR